jgi:hypothetical protein
MTNRLGNTSYDCSSSVFNALIEAQFLLRDISIGNTEALFNDLDRKGWKKVAAEKSGNITAKRGDMVIWETRGQTLSTK